METNIQTYISFFPYFSLLCPVWAKPKTAEYYISSYLTLQNVQKYVPQQKFY